MEGRREERVYVCVFSRNEIRKKYFQIMYAHSTSLSLITNRARASSQAARSTPARPAVAVVWSLR